MTYSDFVLLVDAAYRRDCAAHDMPHLRLGQTYYNMLPTRIARLIHGSELDPFYHDEVSVETHQVVASMWIDTDLPEV